VVRAGQWPWQGWQPLFLQAGDFRLREAPLAAGGQFGADGAGLAEAADGVLAGLKKLGRLAGGIEEGILCFHHFDCTEKRAELQETDVFLDVVRHYFATISSYIHRKRLV
jgi:hypothetical protein